MSDSLETVSKQMHNAHSFVDIFGVISEKEENQQKSSLRKQFGFLAKMVHPDYNPNEQVFAAQVFEELNSFRQAAEEAIKEKTYDNKFIHKGCAPGTVGVSGTLTVQSATDTYTYSEEPFAEGNFSVVYRGIGAKNGAVLLKVSTAPTNNPLVARDAEIMHRFTHAKISEQIYKLQKMVPTLKDNFMFTGAGNTQYRVSVVKYKPDMITVADIIKVYPKGLNPAEASWVCRRVIAQALAARLAEVVHCAIVPDHVLVDPYKHEPLHIGWAQSIETKALQRITMIIDKYKDWYPKEVFNKKPVTHNTDLHMALATCIKVMGGDVRTGTLPSSVPSDIRGLFEEWYSDGKKNPHGWTFFQEYTTLVRKHWGRNWRPLVMP